MCIIMYRKIGVPYRLHFISRTKSTSLWNSAKYWSEVANTTIRTLGPRAIRPRSVFRWISSFSGDYKHDSFGMEYTCFYKRCGQNQSIVSIHRLPFTCQFALLKLGGRSVTYNRLGMLDISNNPRFYSFVKRCGYGVTTSISIHFSLKTKFISLRSFGLVVKKQRKVQIERESVFRIAIVHCFHRVHTTIITQNKKKTPKTRTIPTNYNFSPISISYRLRQL